MGFERANQLLTYLGQLRGSDERGPIPTVRRRGNSDSGLLQAANYALSAEKFEYQKHTYL